MKIHFVCALVLIGLHAFAVYLLPDLLSDWHFLKRTWGFDFLTFYPSSVAVCAYAVAVAVAVPQINLSIAKHIETIVGHVTISKAVLWGGLCLGFGVAFILFKQKYALLGDGYLRPHEVVEGMYYRYSVGVSFVLIYLQKWLRHWDATAILAFQIFSIAWGVPYVVLACVWSDVIGKGRVEKVFCFLLMVLIGSFQYFFGYVEMYAPLPAVMLGFAFFGVLALRRGKFPIGSTVCFVVGLVFHALLLFLTPALLFLWWWSLSQRYSVFRDCRVIGVGVLVACVFGCVFGYYKPDVLMPLFPSEEYPYGILTLWHVWEFFNGQILSAPVALPLLVVSGFAVRRFGWETAFLFLCAAGSVLSLLVVNAVRGSIDWDIYALSGVPLMALATHTLEQVKKRQVKQYVSLVSCVCAGLLILPFVHVNATDRSVDRLIEIIEDDPGSYYISHFSDIHVAMSFKSAGLDSLASVYFEKAYTKNPHDRRNPFNMGMVLFRNDNYAESIPYFLSALDLSPNYEKALDAVLWLVLHVPDLVVDGVETHLSKSSHNEFWIRLGLHGLKTGKVQQVYDVSPEVAVMIARRAQLYIAEKDTVRAAQLLKHAVLGNIQIK